MKFNKITQLLLMTLFAGLTAPMTVLAAEDDEDEESEYDNPWSTIQQVEYSNRAEIGLIYTTDDSLRMGQFNGEVDKGTSLKFDVNLGSINVNDKESADFWNLKITDLGLESRHLAADFGIQGTYKAEISYTEVISRELFMNNATSAYSAGWGTDNLGSASAELGEVDSDLIRKNFKMGISWDFMPNWQLSASLRQEDKEGSRTRGAYPGPDFLAEAIDSELTEFDLVLSYAASHYQANLTVSHSEWENNVNFLDFNTGADQRLGVDPDNSFDQVKFDLAWRIADKTRLFLYAGIGKAEQDDEFLTPSTGIDIVLPQTSLNGEVDYSDFKLALNHKFAANVTLNLSYKYTDRDNKTALNVYEYASVDRAFCFDRFRSIPCTAQNMPLSVTSDEIAADLTYRINSMWTVAGGANIEQKERISLTATDTDENKYWAKVKFRLNSMFNAEAKYTYSDREPNEYVNEAIIRFDGVTDTRVADQALRQSHKAERELNRLQASLRYTPAMAWSFGLAADLKEEQFSQDEQFFLDSSSIATDLLGLKSIETASYTADISYQPNQHLNVTLFVSDSAYDGEQLGGRSDASVTPWQSIFEDDASLVGLNLDWEIIKDRLELEAKITYMDVNQTIDALENDGDFTEYGDIDTDETTVEIDLIYRINPTSELKLAYEYLTYNNNDWQYFNLSSDTFNFTNEVFDDESAQSIALSYVKYY